MKVEINDRLYRDINDYCAANGKDVVEYIEDILTEQHNLNKYGDINDLIKTAHEESKVTVVKVKKEVKKEPPVVVEEPKVVEEVKVVEPEKPVEVKEETPKPKRTRKPKEVKIEELPLEPIIILEEDKPQEQVEELKPVVKEEPKVTPTVVVAKPKKRTLKVK